MLKIENVSKRRGLFELKDISFSLPTGYIMGLIGQNGAGKTTLIHLIMNLIKKDGGRIEIFGLDHEKNEKEIKENIGFVYDENCFYDYLKIRDMSKILSGFYKNWDWKIYRELLDKMELKEEEKIKNLSKGMKMKYAIVTALCHHAKLILMDEPTAGLDPVVRREVLHIFQEYLEKEESSIIFSTHLTSDLDKIADYLTFLKGGRLIFSKTREEVGDEFVLVKGTAETFSDRIKQLSKGYEGNSTGFTALMEKKEWNVLSTEQFLIEKPSVEDMMYYYDRR